MIRFVADVIVSTNQLEVRSKDGASAKLHVTLSWGRNCEPKQLWLHLSKSASTVEILTNFLSIYRAQLQKLDIQARSEVRTPCVPGSGLDGFVPFANVVHAFHDSAISKQQHTQLVDIYATSNLTLKLNGPDYFLKRRSTGLPRTFVAPQPIRPTRCIFQAIYDVHMHDSLADAIQGHAGRSVASTYRHFDLETLARGVAAIPVPGEKSDHQTDADPAIAGHDLPVG
jgi:hypothetical protein